jgi:calcium-dependent protein kinase
MHDHGVVHRDLKFENIMFESQHPEAMIKVIDFGLSKKFVGETGYMTERVGTIYTMAPQVLQGMYSCKADVWR